MSGRSKADPGVILWDGFGLQSLYSGVGRHAWELLQALKRQAVSPRIIPSVPALDAPFLPNILPKTIGWPQSRIKPWALFWLGQWTQNFLREHEGIAIVHGLSNYNVPTLKSSKLRKVLTVHDLIPILQKEEVSAALGLYLRYQLPRAVAAADAIICVSHWTEHTLHEFYPASHGKTVMIPNGWPHPREKNLKNKGSELLTISRHESYKRLDLIPKVLRHLPPQVRWTVVTDEGGLDALKADADSRLILKTRISEHEMQDLHAAADLYVHPSRLEGFCLPAAASISHGVPVIFTRGSGIDEVVGEAGMGLLPGDDARRWSAAIEELLSSTDRAGLCRARNTAAMSWDDVAARTRALYGDVLNG
ncbi:MAG TPA: glycosyltransferase family 1 protein [Oligoflexus sp.]|uniref:glycosyltransferase family 4 protein n=1 Tax=Oligoflexus sp. TaxID=1971216 RepID=UPI002D80FB8D|nr:glycosyltransferase family 1 protein [Oligoflexus sp.]HET9238868.1 glycosyltransferase family 1 protein [Oligoflexus sp.]